MATADVPQTTTLDTDLKTDVCVVGAGIAGLTTAYFLAKEGREVVVLERANLGGGETSRTTAHLAYVIDDGFHEIERLHGIEWLRLHVQSHQSAIDAIERTVREENIDCDFTRLDGYRYWQLFAFETARTAHRCSLAEITRAVWCQEKPGSDTLF
jgi:glycine/D-amino acid oxidase-like deaminating enzyme